MSDPKWQTVSTEIVHKNPWYQVRKDAVITPDGKPGEYFIMQTPGPSVFVVVLTPANEIVLVRQNRYLTPEIYWEIPGGNAEKDAPDIAAKRELQEETGLQAEELIPIGKDYPFIGVVDEISYFYLATKVLESSKNKQAEEQIDTVKAFAIPDVIDMIQNGKINDTQSVSAIFRTLLYLGYTMKK